MAQSFTFAHQTFVQQEQNVCRLALQLNRAITDLANFYNSTGIQGAAFTDAEIQEFGQQFTALTASQVNQGMTDLLAVQAAMTTAILQKFSNLICGVPN